MQNSRWGSKELHREFQDGISRAMSNPFAISAACYETDKALLKNNGSRITANSILAGNYPLPTSESPSGLRAGKADVLARRTYSCRGDAAPAGT